MTIRPEHRRLLLDSAITNEVIDQSGIRSTPTGLEIPWTDGTSPVTWQSRPDEPFTNDAGDLVKYLFPKGAKVPYNRLRDNDNASRVLIVEGSKQQYAALSHAPADMAVYGLSGCWGYRHADLTIAEGRAVWLLLDADIEGNLDVWSAAEDHGKRLKRAGATEVHYVLTTGQGKEGLDDVLAKLPEAKRAESLRRWLSQAENRLPKKPRPKKPRPGQAGGDAAKFFRQRDKPLVFQPKTFADMILAEQPAALTLEGNIALYRNGVYGVDANALLAAVVRKLGDFYSTGYLNQVKDVLTGALVDQGLSLPQLMNEPLLNCPNGMVDLRTGELKGHDPKYMSYIQVTTDYLPDMATPVYDQWVHEALRQDHHTDEDVERLVADLEESASVMLNPAMKDKKVVFLYGPSRSGKSTFLRLMKAIAGNINTSAVTLHDLGTDSFATANLYSKMLNVAADLSNKHVEDLSKFKMAAGADELHANRKYGSQFVFTNYALMAFSANELPTVSEASKAYSARIKPFNFPNTFLGREDLGLEDRLMAELPGIMARWVRAHINFLARGGYRKTDEQTNREFEAKSDRVVQFFQDMCTPVDAAHGQRLGEHEATGRRDVAIAFNAWAERNGGSKMGERAFFQRFSQIEGVAEIKLGSKDRRGFNVLVAKADDDMWGPDDADAHMRNAEPVSDPVPASGVVSEGGWTVSGAVEAGVPVFGSALGVNGLEAASQGFELTDAYGDRSDETASVEVNDPWAAGGFDFKF